MLLQALCDYARSRHLLDDLAFAEKPVRWIIDIDSQGNLIGAGPTDTSTDGKKGKTFSCPRTSKPKNSGEVAEFLADGLKALFGLDASASGGTDADRKASLKRNAFRELLEDCSKEIAAVRPCLAFLDGVSLAPAFLRPLSGKWQITPSAGEPVELDADNFTFRVDGDLLLDNPQVRDWWRKRYRTEIEETAANAPKGRCIVTGKAGQPILDSHTIKIMRVPGGQSSGASLVSFDKDAFRSYGFEKSQNCPTSQEAADAYCTALNALIASDDSSLKIGNTAICFWARNTPKVGTVMARYLHRPEPEGIADFLRSPWAGLERVPPKSDTFFSVALKGCSGRVAVSQWIQEPAQQAVRHLQQWFADLNLSVPSRPVPEKGKKEPDDGKDVFPLSIYWLARTTVREKKSSDSKQEAPSPETVSQLYLAAVAGATPSLTLLPAMLHRLHTGLADKDKKYIPLYDESRFALLKLILNRNRKESGMEIKPSLTADTADPAYNCGRLLAVLSAAQKKAQGYPKGFTGVAERYFASASISPASVFPLLLQLNRHHLDKIRKMGDGNAYEEVAIRDILARLRPVGEMPPDFPAHLNLQGQGRFAIGFYQQQAEDEWQRRTRAVLAFLEQTDAETLQDLRELQETDADAFRKELDGIYCSPACQAWRESKRKEAEQPQADRPAEQLVFDFGDE